MSFILKALQKLEEEKAAQRARPQDINSAILTTGRPALRRSRAPIATAAIAILLLLVGGGSAYLLLQRGEKPARKSVPAALPRESRDVPARPPSAGLLPAVAAVGGGPDRPAATVTATQERHHRPDKKRQPNMSPSPPKSAAVAVKPVTEAVRERPFGPPPAGLKVNGIALRDAPAESVAVVNGLLVRRGMVVQGMKVEEILGDRVRFSGSGGRCEVTVAK